MEQNIAVLWIKDGVLIERMHINAIAFALTYYAFIRPDLRTDISLANLINYAFLKSGYSCSDKIKFFNNDFGNYLVNIDAANNYYNALSSLAAAHAQYFPGIIKILNHLSNKGIKNFITSAISQDVLDKWVSTQQGLISSKYFTQILGSKENFTKGFDHFNFIQKKFKINKIIFIADAESEIALGHKFAYQFNITPIGFANVIKVEQIINGLKVVYETTKALTIQPQYPLAITPQLNPHELLLPNNAELIKALSTNGAKEVVSADNTNSITDNLKKYLIRTEIY